jgi:hypothetical protein
MHRVAVRSGKARLLPSSAPVIKVRQMKYIRRVLISFSALPVLFAIALYIYYHYNRRQYADSIPDSEMSHDVSGKALVYFFD